MYEAFYGLTDEPFNNTPDPSFIYLSESHKAGLAHLVHGIERKKEFTVLIGAAGTGKTTLIHTLIQNLDEHTHVAHLLTPHIEPLGLYSFLLHKFDARTDCNTDRTSLIINLENLLLKLFDTGERCMLIIDEAQELSSDLLNEIKSLSNFETHRNKLIQILLLGTPALRDNIRSHDSAQLRQRIGVIYQLKPLSYYETRGYIDRRLALCGGCSALFTDSAVRAIYTSSDGIPRWINVICDLALFLGLAEEQREIGPDLILEAVEKLDIETRAYELSPERDKNTYQADVIVARQAWLGHHLSSPAGGELEIDVSASKSEERKRWQWALLPVGCVIIMTAVYVFVIGRGNTGLSVQMPSFIANLSQSVKGWGVWGGVPESDRSSLKGESDVQETHRQ